MNLAPVGVLERKSATSFDRFLEEYGPIQDSPSAYRSDFIMHDLMNIMTPVQAIMTYYSPRLGLIEEETNINGCETMAKLAVFSRLMDESATFLSEHFDTMPVRLQRIAEGIPALKRIFPILCASAVFLEEPSRENHQALISFTTDLATVAQALGIEVDPKDNIDINGIEAVIYFNLLNNARKHANGKVEVVKMFNGKTMITNLSKTPLMQEHLQLGVKGESGGSGYGLFVVGLYGVLGNISFSTNSQKDVSSGNFLVSCTVGRPQSNISYGVRREQEIS